MKTATLDDLKTWNPCWITGEVDCDFEDRVKKIAGRRKNWKLKHVAALRGAPGLSDEDWQWLMHTYMDRQGYKSELRLAACYYATRALKRERKVGREPDKRSWEAVRVARRFAQGKATREELDAARDAAVAAARDAAVAAATDAAWAAARDAAVAVARDAAGAAAGAAAWAAAWAAELKIQCDWLQKKALAW